MVNKRLTKIEEGFYWSDKQWKGVDVSHVQEITGIVDLQGYTGNLSFLKSIGDFVYLRGYTGNLNSLESIDGCAYLSGYTGNLNSLKSISGSVYLSGYFKDLPNMPDDFDRVHIEYDNNAITMAEYRKRRGFTQKERKVVHYCSFCGNKFET